MGFLPESFNTVDFKSFFSRTDGRFRLIAIFLSVIIYYILIDFYDKELNIFQYIQFSPKEFQLFTGIEPGLYYQIGEKTSTIDESNKLKLKNVSTGGGNVNPIKVLKTPNSFGFVEDDCYPRDEKVIREGINFISPLYLEQMQIVCRKSISNNVDLKISNFTSYETLRFFSEHKINIGKQGGGTYILSYYIINQLNIQINRFNQKNTNNPLKQIMINDTILNNDLSSIEQFESNQIDIWFFVSGTPLPEIKDVIENGDATLASIEPDIINLINKDNKLELRPTNFYNYETEKNKSTFGTYCYLIANKNVSSFHISAMLDKLNAVSKKYQDLPLSEVDFVSNYEVVSKSKFFIILKNIIIFISTVLLGAIGLSSFIIWGLSKILLDNYTDKFAKITKLFLNNQLKMPDLDLTLKKLNNLKIEIEKICPKKDSEEKISEDKDYYIVLEAINRIGKNIEGFNNIKENIVNKNKLNIDKKYNLKKNQLYKIINKEICIIDESINYFLKKLDGQSNIDFKNYFKIIIINELALDEKKIIKELEEKENLFDFDIDKNQLPIINRLMFAVHKIYQYREKINNIHNEGKLIFEHYKILLDESHVLLEKFKKEIGLRLFYLKKFKSSIINNDKLYEFLYAEYIDMDYFEKIIELNKSI